MDFLYKHAEQAEKEIFFNVADLFSLDVDLIFFDATTVYFEIEDDSVELSPEEEEDGEPRAKGSPAVEGAQRKRGKNKEGRDNSPQVVVALAVTRDGLPVRSWVFPGNTVDVTTIKTVREDLKSWKLSRVLFVGDAGCYSAENLKTLSSGCGRYLLATPLRKVKELYEDVLSRPGRYKQLNEKLEVKEVIVGEGEARRRYFLCRNQREAERARRHRELLLRLLRAKLAELEPQKGADHSKKACALLTSKRFARFLSKDKSGRVFLDPDKVQHDARFDGKWVVTTNDDTLSSEDGALGYKAELIIEACFRRMKTTGIRIRPVYHWLSRRIIAHVKLCVFALLLQRLAEIACNDTWRNIRRALRSIQVVVCETPNGSFVKTTTPSAEALAVLKQLKIQLPPRLLAVLPASAAPPEPPPASKRA
jgi:transposase